ncbi:thiolase family protein [Croceicoccus sp. YJ47]|uniref:thiolase family protein n=1 Tax=Croceicoccus sp. YJ47 TaxID=2798724 RepID=UPI0019219569|nr:thiolase family protein [Croceicoccus sp. YJ47]QQN75296.1 thiolase family protein [Croceicoccus sp. YJ47]
MSEDIYIVGIDMINFGRFPHKTPGQLGAQAALAALDEAEVGIRDIQAVFSGSNYTTMIGQKVLQEIGQTGVQIINLVNACSTGASAIRMGHVSMKAGEFDTVLCVGVEQMTGLGMLGAAAAGPIPTEGLLGSASMPAVFGESGMEYAAKTGATQTDFALVSVKNHHNATMNPKAFLRKETPLEMVLEAEEIAYPLTKLMCSINVDGAAAAVLMTESKVKERGLMDRAIRIRGSAMASAPWGEHDPILHDVNTPTQIAARKAYEMAGVGPDDIDLVELHDCFASVELQHYENLGLCGEGEGVRMIRDGETELGARIPVNVSGGLLSKGHPIAATGIANMYELVLHLRGQAGERQVKDAKFGMAHVVGLGTSAAVHILEKP